MQAFDKQYNFRTFYTLDAERAGAYELSDEKAAHEILRMFFMDFDLDDAQVELWTLLKAALGDPGDNKPDHFVYIYERLFDMMTAAYVVKSKLQHKEGADKQRE